MSTAAENLAGSTGPTAARAGLGAPRLEVRAHPLVSSLPAAEWDALFQGSPEGYDLYKAFEAVPPPGFRLGALTVHDGGRMIAAAPLFRMHFRLDTPFPGRIRALGDWVHARAPRLTGFNILGLGSPMSDNCSVGFAPGLAPEAAAAARAAILADLSRLAAEEKAQVLVVKSLGPEMEAWNPDLVRLGYNRIKSVPVVMLDLGQPGLESYYASLPEKTSSYFKRKLRPAADLRIEYRTSVAGLEAPMMALYEATLAQSQFDYGDFDKLHPDFFRSLVDGVGEAARLMLCWRGDELLSFQIFLVGSRRIIASKIGMKYPEAREYNLYFVNWLKMIEFATEHGIPEIEMGATTYQAKLLFGGRLEPRWIYFRFRGAVANTLTKPFHGLFDFERNDPELKRMKAAAAEAARAAAKPAQRAGVAGPSPGKSKSKSKSKAKAQGQARPPDSTKPGA